MTVLQFYIGLSALWIAIAWLPYILDRIMVRGLMGALANYDPNATPQSPWAQRAMRAHTVAVESFVAFAPIALLASTKQDVDPYASILAMTYFFGIFAHYIIYCIGVPVLRTVAFAVAALSTVVMGLHVVGWV